MNMKSHILLLLALPLLWACSKDFVPADGGYFFPGEWAPVHVVISVTDREGTDLLDPEREDNFFKNASIRYKGETYPARMDGARSGTKSYHADIYGYFLIQQDGWKLIFGEIDGALEMEEDLILNWPDGTSDTLHYHCGSHNLKDMTCDRSWTLNGEHTSLPVTLVK